MSKFPRKSISWRARALNAVTRLTSKRMIESRSIEDIRCITGVVDRRMASVPKEVELLLLKQEAFEGEFITLGDVGADKVLLYIPGGGFMFRTPAGYRRLVIRLCRALRSQACIVHYRLAPEHPYPCGLEDCLSAYQYLLSEGFDARDIVLVGDSAGGNLALVMLQRLRDQGRELPVCAVLFSPVLDLTFSGASFRGNADVDPVASSDGPVFKTIHRYYGRTSARNPEISPLFGKFDDLPPILAQVGSTEIVRDDSVRAAEKARRAGTEFELEVWKGVPHVWPIMSFLPEAREAVDRVAQFVHHKTNDKPAR